MATAQTVGTEIFHTETEQVARYVRRYQYVREMALSEVKSLSFLSELAAQLYSKEGP